MQKLALFLSVASLVAAGWFAWNSCSASCAIRGLEARVAEMEGLDTRVTALESKPAATPTPAPAPAVVERRALETGDSALAGAPRPAEVVRAAAAAERAAASLDERIRALEEKSKAAENAGLRVARAGTAFGRPGNLYTSVDDAKEDLELTGSQEADFERIVADARRELEDLRKIPDDEGKTWDQATQEGFQGLLDGSMKLDLSKMTNFRKKTVPGRTETFGQAEDRIRTGAKSRLRDTLSSAQQSKFDKAHVDPLIGSGMGTPTMSVMMTADDLRPSGGR